jgi:hypothetical protein
VGEVLGQQAAAPSTTNSFLNILPYLHEPNAGQINPDLSSRQDMNVGGRRQENCFQKMHGRLDICREEA